MKILIANFLLATTLANAATLRLDFPPMPVNRAGVGIMLAEREPFTGTMTFDGGQVLSVSGGIPATYVRGFGAFYTVDRCTGTGNVGGDLGAIRIDLPPEPVRWRNGVMTALAITADVTVTMADGRIARGTIDFPDCPTRRLSFGKYLADAVTATGSVSFR